MQHSKSFFRIGRVINLTWLPKEERKAIRAAHPAPEDKRFKTRKEAETANTDPENFKVFECSVVSLGMGGF